MLFILNNRTCQSLNFSKKKTTETIMKIMKICIHTWSGDSGE